MSQFDSCDITKDSLVVIGNGFDLAHGLKTKYSDFRSWLISHEQGVFVQSMEKMFYALKASPRKYLWQDLERALGSVDIDMVHKLYHEEHEGKDVFDVLIEPTLLQLPSLFRLWIKSVRELGYSSVSRILCLPKDAHYFSFNYTDTLEYVYGIPQNHICYIHGSQASNDKLIVGCLNNPISESIFGKEEFDAQHYLVRYKSASFLNEFLRKNTRLQIEKHKSFFNQLSEVNRVVVIGHSLSEVDWPYFIEIRKSVAKDALWLITYHTTNDKIKLQSNLVLNYIKNIQYKRF